MWFCTTTNDDVKCNITWRRRRRVWARARDLVLLVVHTNIGERARDVACIHQQNCTYDFPCVSPYFTCFVSACLRYFSCAISTLLVSSVLFFLFNIRILTSPRTVSVFALYMHIFHSVFLSHTAFSPKPNKPTGIRSLVIHFASIRFVWFFFSFRIVSFHCSSLLLLCLLFQPRSFHFCFCYLFFLFYFFAQTD